MGHLKLGLVTGIAFAAISAACALAEEPALTRFEFEQIRFAAPVRLTFYAASEDVANQASWQVFDRLKAIDGVMSDYDPDSELMRLRAASGPGQPISVGDDLFSILKASERFSRMTDGAFDVSVGPVTRLWRVARRRKQLPPQDALGEALTRIDWRSIVLDDEKRTVELRRPEMRIDLGGIAQGYAVDEAFRILNDAGITRLLIDVSGDIRVGEPPPGELGWRIAVQALQPHSTEKSETDGEPPAGEPRILVLSNTSVSTSGDAYQHVEIDGVRYSHIVDPKTGLGLTRPVSVTIIAPDAITADALATALSVQGPDRGFEMLDRFENVEALFAWFEEGELNVRESDGFP